MDDLKKIEKLLSESEKKEEKKVEVTKQSKCKCAKVVDGYHSAQKVGIQKLFSDVEVPQYKHKGDSCCDVRAYRVVKLMNDMGVEIEVPEDFKSITLYQGYSARIGTGFKLDVPEGWCVNIEGRSGFSFDEGIVVTNAPGKAEYTYKGEYMVNLTKVNKKPTVIYKNDRIAQMEIVPQHKMIFEEVDKVHVEDGNERVENGLGSSGVK